MGAHAFLAPSSAARWVKCPASPTLEARYPQADDTPDTMLGTAAHWAAEQTLRGAPPALDSLAPNGVPVDAEMLDAAEMVYNDVRDALFPYYGQNWRAALVIEQRVTIPAVHPTHNWGTPDLRAWARLPDGRLLLFVWDFKYGHKIVEAFENWQLIDYTSGLLTEAGVNGLTDQQTVVDLRVIQPRAFHRDGPVRSWRVMASDLRGYVNRLRNSADEATGGNPSARPDPDACENCNARHACEALQREAYRAMETAYRAQSLDLDATALGLELRFIKRAKALLEARESGLEEQATARIKRGESVAWFAMESSPGRAVWTRPVDEVLALGQMVGQNFAKAPEPITPTQAIKLAPQLEKLVQAISTRPTGSAKLVPDDGTRARRVFSRMT